jgi:DNA repair photolyase
MTGFRWKVADEGEPVLFGADELFVPDLGTGRMSDLEFLHVTAKRILNHVPSGSRAPTNWTINVYRGCSHACSYCLAGETPVLLADGRARPIADLRAGDRVYGTVRVGSSRRLLATDVLDHWQSQRRAYRLTLADGTRIVASGDHRFLTDRGWEHVVDAAGSAQRPHLTTNSELLGIGRLATTRQRLIDDVAVGSGPPLRVSAIEDLGIEIPMYDITTGTGDFIADGVVSHNCFARPTHEYLGLNRGEDFDRKIVVKINAVEKLRAELADAKWRREPVAMGTNTDPYQRAEAKYRLTRGVLEALTEYRTPFSILTKSPLVTRDLDLLQEANEVIDVSVNFSIATLEEDVWRASEPGSPHPRRRIDAMRRMSEAGIRTGALMAPVLPGLSDDPRQLREVVAAIRDTGATLLGLGALYLRPGVREHFLAWLHGVDPDLHADYVRRYATSDYAPERYFAELYRRAGVDRSSATFKRRR